MRKKVLITVLIVITGLFVSLLVILNSRNGEIFNQTVHRQTGSAPVTGVPQEELIGLSLDPYEIATAPGQTVRITMTFKNVESPMDAADLILDYDPALMEFVGVESLAPGYINPRKLVRNNRLILSFARDIGNVEQGTQQELAIAELVFRTLSVGTTKLVPVINTKEISSMVTTENNSDKNQLTSVNEVEITIE